ncbi:hypothetical protein BIV60_18215 [Bacillus sp. MUM 116]|uniref:hypothetical protein n=1 Tax=Bacillus sp. MUM 116 TaxID=1678002 RepID=UPI0008F5D71D|nr:hypothetical protein [Bacillus sp. MUM 116]OIK11340.1 hypothetical protein BIV60_18215 [Bacillus sp. MUM 116]
MKKFLSLFMAGFIILLMFVVPGSPVKADCGCNVSPIVGAEKNKIVAKLISNEEFKKVKLNSIHEGYSWKGVKAIEVIKDNDNGIILVGVPFINKDGSVEMFAFMDGHFLGISPSH